MTARDPYRNKAEAFEASDDIPVNEMRDAAIGTIIARRYGRREVLKGLLAVPVTTALFGPTAAAAREAPRAETFPEVQAGVDATHHAAEGYETTILLRWGDAIVPGLPPFDPRDLDATGQARRFGYNCDYITLVPRDAPGRALLCVNHEYTSPELMFAGVGRPDKNDFKFMDKTKTDVELEAHGVSVVELKREGGQWAVVLESTLNRRITGTTPMTADGPAAGHPRLRTADDPSGLHILGTLNNCGGGVTPWGTYLTCEENFHGYFWTERRDDKGKPLFSGSGRDLRNASRYGIPGNWYNWGRHHARFNTDLEPNEANRFGWIVEIDPADPTSVPVKHTALGRFRHECADVVVSAGGHIVVYSGDDQIFEYVYRYVSKDVLKPGDMAHNRRLLAEGTLSAARFEADGSVIWLPLVHGQGPLTAENGFESQADVLIEARTAAELMGATPMDRPEDVETNPRNGRVYLVLTNNWKREKADAANPRPENAFGHVIEMTPPGGDHTAPTYRWDILVRCGDPTIASVGANWGPETSADGWFAAPDNLAFDKDGRLWVATDQGEHWGRTGRADGLYAVETDGNRRGTSRLFFRVPVGAEMCGPCFDTTGEALFLSVQHPGADAPESWAVFGREATFEDPPTRWPDFQDGMPPRPSVLVVTKKGGGRIA